MRDFCKEPALLEAQKEAENNRKGLWSLDAVNHVRKVTWEIPDARQLVEEYRGKKIKAVVENVRDGSTVRAFLMPSDGQFYHVTIMLSGVRVSQSAIPTNLKFFSMAICMD